MERQFPQRVENYTNPALWMGLVNLFWVLALIWSTLGFGVVLLTGFALRWAIDRLGDRIRAREAARAWPKPKPGDTQPER